MTTFVAIPNGDLDQDSPITQPLMTALRDNPIAIAEAATGAPVMVAGWHPYDMVNVGDGNDGVFYDFAVNGTQATITTPDFSDGYEYKVILSALGCSGTANLVVELYRETDAAWSTVWTSTNTSSGPLDAEIDIHIPRVAKTVHFVSQRSVLEFTPEASTSGFWDITIQKILKARISWSSGNIDGGTAKLYRRGMLG